VRTALGRNGTALLQGAPACWGVLHTEIAHQPHVRGLGHNLQQPIVTAALYFLHAGSGQPTPP
jgi:hypothetical protein